MENERKLFVGYEYHEVTVKQNTVSMYADSYKNLGWQFEGETVPRRKFDSVVMKFKRDRKIRNKAELTRLQRQFEAGVSEILVLEAAKHFAATIAAYTTGIVGTVFMAGAVFSITANMLVPCMILAIPAFIGWISPYFIYKRMEKKKSTAVTPLIDQKYNELYMVCEKANRLLDHIND